jgi:hypothetical protein
MYNECAATALLQGESFHKQLKEQQQQRLKAAKRQADAIAKVRLSSRPPAVLQRNWTDRATCCLFTIHAHGCTSQDHCSLAERMPC